MLRLFWRFWKRREDANIYGGSRDFEWDDEGCRNAFKSSDLRCSVEAVYTRFLEMGQWKGGHEVVVALIFFLEEEGRRQRHTLDESRFWIKYDGWNIMQRRRKEGRKEGREFIYAN
jgi:hypothetical protein